MGKKNKKPKAVNFRLISATDPAYNEPYRLLREVRQKWHYDTIAARVALAWRIRTTSDVDGHLVLGKCIRVTDLNKEFAQFDFIITLNQEVWSDLRFTHDQKMALLDHEMCHAAVAYDDDGEPIYDERNRRVFRSRKHDIEEFSSVVEHHGTYKRDLEDFARVLLKKQATPLFADENETKITLPSVQ